MESSAAFQRALVILVLFGSILMTSAAFFSILTAR
jgi:hypothetical protein